MVFILVFFYQKIANFIKLKKMVLSKERNYKQKSANKIKLRQILVFGM